MHVPRCQNVWLRRSGQPISKQAVQAARHARCRMHTCAHACSSACAQADADQGTKMLGRSFPGLTRVRATVWPITYFRATVTQWV